MSNIRLQQTLIIGAILLLVAFLFTRNVKGLVKPEEEKTETQASKSNADQILNLDQISLGARNMLSTPLAAEILDLENKYKTASDGNKDKIAMQLANKWDDLSQPLPSALYFEIIAKNTPDLKNWINSGDKFLQAFESTQDSVLHPALLEKANASYAEALKIDSASIPAKMGMGITIVNGMGAPMQGIAMLLDVVSKDPNNLQANMQLGMFSMKSGQFDKAVSRFEHVLTIKKSSEAYFYLATAFENLNKNKEAIDAYLESKKIAANPTLSKFIDKKVAELKN